MSDIHERQAEAALDQQPADEENVTGGLTKVGRALSDQSEL